MSTKAITIRLDEDTASALQQFAKSVGLSTNALATVVLKQAAKEKRVVLEEEPTLTPTPYLEARLREFHEDYKKNGLKNTIDISTPEAIEELFANIE